MTTDAIKTSLNAIGMQNEVYIAHFAINMELKKILQAFNEIVVQQERIAKLIYPKHPERIDEELERRAIHLREENGLSSDMSTHD